MGALHIAEKRVIAVGGALAYRFGRMALKIERRDKEYMDRISDERILQELDEIEARMRGLESRLFSIRERLRQRVDPFKRRKDLGYFYEDEPAREAK